MNIKIKNLFKHICFKKNSIINKLFSTILIFLISLPVFADQNYDPTTKASMKLVDILFGPFAISICTIALGATFIAAKFGKVTWDRFIYIIFCISGYLGTKIIIQIIHSAVG